MVNLICPSCGGSLSIPEDLKIAHCLYCGAKIFLDDLKMHSENENYERYVELAKTALEVKNYDETINYCNKALEINTRNADLWINKAIATFWLSTENNNRYDEAVKYLTNAELISKDKKFIQDVHTELTEQQAKLLNSLGLKKLEMANKYYQMLMSSIPTTHTSGRGLEGIIESWNDLTTQVAGIGRAKRESAGGFIEAMNFFVKASNYAPQNKRILENISSCAKKANWIDWNVIEGVNDKQQLLREIRENENLQLDKKQQNDKLQEEILILEKLISKSEEKLNKRKSNPKRTGFFSNLIFEPDEEIEREIKRMKYDLKEKRELLTR